MKKLLVCLLTLTLVQGSIQAAEWLKAAGNAVGQAAGNALTAVTTPLKNYNARNASIKAWWEVPATATDLEAYLAKVKAEGSFSDDDAIKRDLVNAKNEFGETRLLLLASRCGLELGPDVLECLVKLGADIKATDNYGNTVFSHLDGKGLTDEHPLYATLEKFDAIQLAATSDDDDAESTTDDDDDAESTADDDDRDEHSASAGSAATTPRGNSIGTSGGNSTGPTAGAPGNGLDSDDEEESNADDESSDDADNSQTPAQVNKSLFTTKNALITLGVAGVVGISYYFYNKSSKKSAPVARQTATRKS